MSSRMRVIITLFILFNSIAIVIGKPYQHTPVGQFLYPYLIWTRQLQQWRLFTPSPRVMAFKYRVDLTFADGTRTSWMRPYPPKWDFFERQKCYHWQKYDLATNRLDSKDTLWPGLVRYVSSLFDSPANPIVSMELIRMAAARQPPRPEGYVMHGDDALQWSSIIVFTYDARTGQFTKGELQ